MFGSCKLHTVEYHLSINDKNLDYFSTLGYTGTDCSENIDDCSSVQCPNNAECVDMEAEAFCRCPPSKEGPNCDRGKNCLHILCYL